MEGQLLATARPYLQLFSLFTLMPPPSSYERSNSCFNGRLKPLWMFIFGCYTCCVLVLGTYVAKVNIAILNLEVKHLELEDFTYVMGQVHKHFYTLSLVTIHGYMIVYYRRLGRIYTEIAKLELDINAASQCHGGQPYRQSFRRRLAMRCGLWLITVCLAYPRLVIPVLTDYMSWPDKICTVFILLVLQFKSVEFTLFVLIVQELLLCLRHTLIQLQQEIASCEQRMLLQALCLALQRNKQMLSRIWRLVGELEGYFMMPMLLMFLYNGLGLLHVVNWAYIQALNPNDCCRYWRFGNLMILQINLLIPCWLSQNCINTYNSFNRIIHNIRCGFGKIMPPMLSRGLQEYALQLEHLKLRFTCGGFFDINLKYFGGMVVTLISYATILIQFKLQALLEAKQAAPLRMSNNSSAKA